VSLLVGERHQIDLLLPAAVPLHKLAEPTRDAINQRLRSIGAEELCGRGEVASAGKVFVVFGAPNHDEARGFVMPKVAVALQPPKTADDK
jgi:hypothetical protein